MNLIYNFNRIGMSEEELLFYCKMESSFPNGTMEESELYGSGRYLREYGFYPMALPLRLHTDHGPNQWDFVTPHMLNSDAVCLGFFSERLKREWELKSKKKPYIVKSPYWYYRTKYQISKSHAALGSLFFHAHSTLWTNKETDYDLVFRELEKLPSQFKPFSVCLHFVDVIKGRYKPYMERNIPVYTAGNSRNGYFINNFYEIIRNFNFAVSNSFGSQIFYCTDFGLPFTIVKAEPLITDNIDSNIIATGMHFSEHRQVQKCYDVFGGVNLTISDAQIDLTREELGITDGIPRLKMAYVLYRSYLFFLFRRVVNKARRVIKWV